MNDTNPSSFNSTEDINLGILIKNIIYGFLACKIKNQTKNTKYDQHFLHN